MKATNRWQADGRVFLAVEIEDVDSNDEVQGFLAHHGFDMDREHEIEVDNKGRGEDKFSRLVVFSQPVVEKDQKLDELNMMLLATMHHYSTVLGPGKLAPAAILAVGDVMMRSLSRIAENRNAEKKRPRRKKAAKKPAPAAEKSDFPEETKE